jgi:hypothetical protein
MPSLLRRTFLTIPNAPWPTTSNESYSSRKLLPMAGTGQSDSGNSQFLAGSDVSFWHFKCVGLLLYGARRYQKPLRSVVGKASKGTMRSSAWRPLVDRPQPDEHAHQVEEGKCQFPHRHRHRTTLRTVSGELQSELCVLKWQQAHVLTVKLRQQRCAELDNK